MNPMSDENKPDHQQVNSELEIYLLEQFKTIWSGRFLILIVTFVFIIVGLFVAFGSTQEFSSQVKVFPENQQISSMGSLGGLARQFGISPGQETFEGIPPSIYPEIARSLGLMTLLMEYEVTLPETDLKVSLFEYFTEHQQTSAVDFVSKYTIGLPFTLLGWVSGWFTAERDEEVIINQSDDPKAARMIRLTSEQWKVIEILRNRVSVSMERKDNGIVAISVMMPDAVMAADVADQVVQYLTEYIMDYRTEKARRDLEFIEDRYVEIKSRFEEAQVTLAEFTDRQRSTTRATDDIQLERLQSVFNLTFRLYTNVAERLEQARIKLHEDTPIVMILESASVPDRRSKPNRPLTLVVFTLLGGFLSVGYVLIKPVVIKLKGEIAKIDNDAALIES
jgi:uncharacterized protein involved in exopolysaccharide biosynthesis